MSRLKHPASIRLWLTIVAFSIITYFLTLVFGYLVMPEFINNMSHVLIYVIEAFFTIFLLRRYFKNSQLSAAALLRPSETEFSWLKLIGLFICAFCISEAATFLFRIGASQQFPELITRLASNPPITESMSSGYYFVSILIYVIFVAFLAPIWEEYIFRGLLLNQWMDQYGSWKGIVFSSLFFGVLHLDHFFGATLVGLMFACIAVETRTLKYTTILHLVFNNLASIESYQVLFTLKRIVPITTNPYLEYATLPTVGLTVVILLVSAIPYTLYMVHSKRNLSEDAVFLTYEY